MSTPPSVLGAEENKKIVFEKSQSFDIKANNSNYKLKISYNEQLLFFEIEKVSEFPKNNYNKYFNFEDLGKIDRYFFQFETILEVVDSLSNLIQTNNLTISEEDKQMKIQITNPSNKKKFDIIIPLKEKDLKTELDTIIPYITSLNERVKKLENEVSNLKSLEEKVNDLMSIKKEYEKMKKEEIKKENRYFKNSNIIKIEDENIILNFFEKKPNKFTLLLDSKIHGDATQTFINKCVNKCPTITFVKTTNGFRFGGFTSKLWTKNNYVKDDKCFIFSLDKKEKYNITNSNNATYCEDSDFYFGSAALRIYNNCTSNQNNYVSGCSFSTVPQNYGINGGEQYFTVSSYEVYQLEY